MGDFKLICRGMQHVLQSRVLCIGILDAAGVLLWQHYTVFIPARHLLLTHLLELICDFFIMFRYPDGVWLSDRFNIW